MAWRSRLFQSMPSTSHFTENCPCIFSVGVSFSVLYRLVSIFVHILIDFGASAKDNRDWTNFLRSGRHFETRAQTHQNFFFNINIYLSMHTYFKWIPKALLGWCVCRSVGPSVILSQGDTSLATRRRAARKPWAPSVCTRAGAPASPQCPPGRGRGAVTHWLRRLPRAPVPRRRSSPSGSLTSHASVRGCPSALRDRA